MRLLLLPISNQDISVHCSRTLTDSNQKLSIQQVFGVMALPECGVELPLGVK